MNIVYKISTANYDNILGHLLKCSDNFIPHLTDTVDINIYAKKIIDKAICFEAWDNEELIGLIAAYFNDEKEHKGYITNVSTVKEYFGKGIGAQLMKMCIDYATTHQFKEIILEVRKQNTAIRLYEKYQFAVVSENNDMLTMKRII